LFKFVLWYSIFDWYTRAKHSVLALGVDTCRVQRGEFISLTTIEEFKMDMETWLTIAVVLVTLPIALISGFAVVLAYVALNQEK